MFGILNPRIHIHIPLEKWDLFETIFKKDKITHKQTNEQSHESEIQLNFWNNFHLFSHQNVTKCCVKAI